MNKIPIYYAVAGVRFIEMNCKIPEAGTYALYLKADDYEIHEAQLVKRGTEWILINVAINEPPHPPEVGKRNITCSRYYPNVGPRPTSQPAGCEYISDVCQYLYENREKILGDYLYATAKG